MSTQTSVARKAHINTVTVRDLLQGARQAAIANGIGGYVLLAGIDLELSLPSKVLDSTAEGVVGGIANTISRLSQAEAAISIDRLFAATAAEAFASGKSDREAEAAINAVDDGGQEANFAAYDVEINAILDKVRGGPPVDPLAALLAQLRQGQSQGLPEGLVDVVDDEEEGDDGDGPYSRLN